jgi:cytidylate kinase
MPVVTVSGAMGSGAREIAELAARQSGLDYVDREILARAAQSLGVSVTAVEQRDERPATLGERLASMLRTFLERSAVAGGDPALGPEGLGIVLSRRYGEIVGESPSEPPDVDERRYIDAITDIIEALAQSGNVVLLGRGSPVILRDRPDSLHVLTTAPLDLRVRRVALRDEMSVEEATRRVHDSDRGRIAFHRKFFKVDADDPALFDLVIHTGRLPYEVGADLVVKAVSGLEAPPA